MPDYTFTDKDFETYTRTEWELAREVKALIDENLDNEKVLQCAANIAIALLGVYAPDGNADTIAMDLQEYAHERQEIAKNPRHDDGWAKEFATSVDAFIAYGEKKWGSRT